MISKPSHTQNFYFQECRIQMTVSSLAMNTVDLEANQVNCNIFLGFRLHAFYPPRS